MINWSEELYLGEEAGESQKKIITNIKDHKFQMGVYVIILAVNGRDIFDIIPSYMLGADSYKGRDITILGLAKGKEESKELAQQMIMDVYSKTGGFDIRGYFS